MAKLWNVTSKIRLKKIVPSTCLSSLSCSFEKQNTTIHHTTRQHLFPWISKQSRLSRVLTAHGTFECKRIFRACSHSGKRPLSFLTCLSHRFPMKFFQAPVSTCIISRAVTTYPWSLAMNNSDKHVKYAWYIIAQISNTFPGAELQESKSRIIFLTVPEYGI